MRASGKLPTVALSGVGGCTQPRREEPMLVRVGGSLAGASGVAECGEDFRFEKLEGERAEL
jgi:hypothetical protein